ncbi:hydrogenase maturation protease [Cellulomonas sp. KRMCY2]|uniref:hydrogenase maturation protease n=1 Tax=Cellulomonas sp. KRMCY2 TaxID=1304865 RepID=UPI00045E7F37|nr:hydrogenase maturation protease [Cellulomonas sp. KRMCY2]
MTERRLVIGLGSPDRGDDAVGTVVARRVEAAGLPGVTVVVHEDPTALIDLWSDTDMTVVVDAVRSGGPAGGMLLVEAGSGAAPLADQAWARTGRGGTHAFGLAAAVELGRALGRLPARLVVVGVEGAGFEHGAPLSDAVAGAVDPVVDAVLALVARDEAVVTGVPR